jgi:hypothetical protein
MDLYHRERLARVYEYMQLSVEIRAVKDELAYQKAVQHHIALLHVAYDQFDYGLLNEYVTVATVPPLNMQPQFSPQLRAAMKRRDDVAQTRKMLQEATTACELDGLHDAISFAHAARYPQTHPELQSAVQLYERIAVLEHEAQQAMQTGTNDVLRSILQNAQAQKINNRTTQAIQQRLNAVAAPGGAGVPTYTPSGARPSLMDGSSVREHMLQKKQRLLEMMDVSGAAKVDVEMRRLDVAAHKDKYRIDVNVEVMERADWANDKFFCWDRASLAEGMLLYTESDIHHSLTTMAQCTLSDPDDKQKLAKELFERLVKYGLGDCHAHDMLEFMRGKHHIANELYAQLIKQLTAVPIGTVRDRYWKLFGLMLQYFGPNGEDFQRSVHEFLIRREAVFFEALLMERVFPNALPPEKRPVSGKSRMFANSVLNDFPEEEAVVAADQPRFVPGSSVHLQIPPLSKADVESAINCFSSPLVTADERKSYSKNAVKRLRCFFI